MLRAGRAPHILSVSELAQLVRSALDAGVGTVWVAGEISNLKRPASGHLYFTLKDDRTQLGAVMFRSAAQVLVFQPADGMDVVVRARADLYPARGALQLYVEAMEPRGLGALTLAFEQLKARLGAEGLFADARKRPLPRWPRAVGIVTALHGAAIHDMRTVLARRWPAAAVVLRPVRVQGRGAAREIAAGIEDLNRLADVDVVIIGRGGGSLEDLWAFNEEVVARAIVASRIPVVSAVGHEIDFTIADFVADARAPTPTAAAALVVPDQAEVVGALARAEAGLRGALARRVGRSCGGSPGTAASSRRWAHGSSGAARPPASAALASSSTPRWAGSASRPPCAYATRVPRSSERRRSSTPSRRSPASSAATPSSAGATPPARS